jgi:predicted lipoprotein with Yx(FWY)xxD motif
VPKTASLSLLTLLASLSLAACGGSSYSAGSSTKSSSPAATSAQPVAATGSGAVVKTAANATLGATVLTDSAGMTLYRLSGERAGSFICTSAACLQAWHPVKARTSGAIGAGVSSLGAVKRPDGSMQVTYQGMPLYTFAQDRPGQANGQGFKDVGTWNAVTVAGAAKTTGAGESSSPPSSGGYHY